MPSKIVRRLLPDRMLQYSGEYDLAYLRLLTADRSVYDFARWIQLNFGYNPITIKQPQLS